MYVTILDFVLTAGAPWTASGISDALAAFDGRFRALGFGPYKIYVVESDAVRKKTTPLRILVGLPGWSGLDQDFQECVEDLAAALEATAYYIKVSTAME